ncbi:MAG TPA: HPP family protein [Longimicrobiaceae bacterium]|nr:HPP family protein [Longimicrobiaceae bacterium]
MARRLSEVVFGLLRRLRLVELVRHHNPRYLLALFGLINGSLSIGLLAVLAHETRSSFLFPSLGPTAFLHYYQPSAAASSPRNTLIGHFIGAAMGWASLALFGLLTEPPALTSGVSWARAGAAALSLGGTSALMVLLRAAHPPAGATTLIVSLGLMPHLWQIPVLMAAVLLLTGQAFLINRLAGIPYPLWTPLPRSDALLPDE